MQEKRLRYFDKACLELVERLSTGQAQPDVILKIFIS
jgi:hypothetical protein